jgi:superoxide dismutase
MEADFNRRFTNSIESAFGTFEEFKAKFSKAGATQFVQVGLGFVFTKVEN